MSDLRHDLPSDITAAIHAGRKMDAIKMLREAQGLGLKEAKHAVEAYIRAHPELKQQQQANTNGISIVAIIAILGFVIYQLVKD